MYISANLNASLIRGIELKNPVLVDRAKEVPSSSQDGAGLACKDNSTFLKGSLQGSTCARWTIEEEVGQVASLQ